MDQTTYGAFCPSCGTENPECNVNSDGALLLCCGAFDPIDAIGFVPRGEVDPIRTDLYHAVEAYTELEMVQTGLGENEEPAGPLAAAMSILEGVIDQLAEERNTDDPDTSPESAEA